MTRVVRPTLLAIVVMALAAYSCAEAPPPVQAAKALSVTATSVDTAMKVAGDLYRAGKITDAQKAQILTAYDTYQRAAKTAYGAVKAWHDAKAGQPSDQVMADVRIAADGLVSLIEILRR